GARQYHQCRGLLARRQDAGVGRVGRMGQAVGDGPTQQAEAVNLRPEFPTAQPDQPSHFAPSEAACALRGLTPDTWELETGEVPISPLEQPLMTPATVSEAPVAPISPVNAADHLKLAQKVANRYLRAARRLGIDEDDWISESYVGLVKAAR